MLSKQFIERLILLLVGSLLSFLAARSLMEQMSLMDLELHDTNAKSKLELKLGHPLELNAHEQSLLSCVVFPESVKIYFNDIGGLEDTKKKIRSLVIKPLQRTTLPANHLLKPPNGIIFHGPPGTGKTMLAKALAMETGSVFINFSMASIENKMFGESAKLLKSLFSLADKVKPCVIFMDELDGFSSERNAFDQSFVNGLKTQMLTYLDGLETRDDKIVIIGATNRLSSIDKAMRRRMRLHIEIPLPDYESRKSILIKNLECIGVDDEIIDEFAKSTDSFSGSDLYEMCKYAAHLAFMADDTNIDISHLKDALEVFKNGIC